MKGLPGTLTSLRQRVTASDHGRALNRRKSLLAALSVVLIVVLVATTSTLLSSPTTANEDALPTTGPEEFFPPSQRSTPTLNTDTSELPSHSNMESPPPSPVDAPTGSNLPNSNESSEQLLAARSHVGQPALPSANAAVPQTTFAASTSPTNMPAQDTVVSTDQGTAQGTSDQFTVDENSTVQSTDESRTGEAHSSTDESSPTSRSSEPTTPATTSSPSATEPAPIEPELRGSRPGGNCPRIGRVRRAPPPHRRRPPGCDNNHLIRP